MYGLSQHIVWIVWVKVGQIKIVIHCQQIMNDHTPMCTQTKKKHSQKLTVKLLYMDKAMIPFIEASYMAN